MLPREHRAHAWLRGLRLKDDDGAEPQEFVSRCCARDAVRISRRRSAAAECGEFQKSFVFNGAFVGTDEAK